MEQTELTQEELDRLQAELDHLRGPRRAEIVEAIAVARGHGDLSENFEYHAAKNEQGLLEHQIAVLEQKLAAAVVVERAASRDGTASIGSVVEFEDDDGERAAVTISNAGGAGAVSPQSPLGTALLGKAAGDTVDVNAPSGKWSARVVSVS
jgi:transcription elongation factor GreA